MQNDSGYPANWMPDVIRLLPKQVVDVVPAGAGVAVMKGRRHPDGRNTCRSCTVRCAAWCC